MKINEIISEDWDKEGSSISLDPNRTNYEIRNYHKLDKYLAELCNMVEQHGNEGSNGMVAAGVLSLTHPYIARLSSIGDDGKSTHAERNAIDAFESEYGPITEGAVIITTLSPCNEHNDVTAQERNGESCTELLNEKGIQKVYCGFMDPTQDDDRRQFNIMETANEDIRNRCKQYADTFLNLSENFKDGRNPQDKGDSKRYNVPTKSSVSNLRKVAKHSSGRKAQLAHWMANMKAGRAKND